MPKPTIQARRWNKPQGMLDELCLIDKPLDWTSFDVVAKLRNAYSKKVGSKCKVGHAGTLDPKATGLLLVAVGKKTKEVASLEILDKEYIGEFKLGATTKSFDTETDEENICDYSRLSLSEIEQTANLFLGKQLQKPPMFSATWHNGKRLYELARNGKEVSRSSKPIEIFEFDLTTIALPVVAFRITVSKGAYIRTIASDFGEKLGVGAYLKSLRRTRIGGYKVEDAFSIERALELIASREIDL